MDADLTWSSGPPLPADRSRQEVDPAHFHPRSPWSELPSPPVTHANAPTTPDADRRLGGSGDVRDDLRLSSLVRAMLALLQGDERRRLAWIVLGMLISALVATVGVAAILPFMRLVAAPDAVQEHRWLGAAYDALDVGSPAVFLFFLGLGTLALLVMSNALRAFTDWRILRFVRDAQDRLSRRLLAQYLSEPYTFFLGRNSAMLSQNILAEVQSVVNGVLTPAMKGLAQAVVTIFIVSLLLVVDVLLALVVLTTLGAAYGAIFHLIRRQQIRLGRARLESNALRYRLVDEAFGGIKDLKVLGRERHYLDRFSVPSRRFARVIADNAMMAELPRYALETIAFGGILLIILYLLGSGREVVSVLPLLSLYAFAAYRLMPSLQQVFSSVTQVRFNAPALQRLRRDLEEIGGGRPVVESARDEAEGSLQMRREVRLNGVSFAYPGSDVPALRSVDLVLPRNRTVGLVGPTGSGKTTLVDLLLGLFAPTQGTITIDEEVLDERMLPSWRLQLVYVPQQIFLSDDSILRNIAFGIPEAVIDRLAAERAARVAQLHDFIATLPDGYDTLVGERGVRLSGGQRQRIGIARALYHDPDVLIMDEATSALDILTEDAVMDAIRGLAGRKTMVLIAHRLSTVKACDVIYMVEGGRITGFGSYAELTRSNVAFRAMAGVTTGRR